MKDARQKRIARGAAMMANVELDTVMVVGQDGKVSPRKVKIGSSKGSSWVVTDGLKAGEQVMVDGFQKLRGTAPVKPVPWQPAASGAKPAAAAASAPASAASGT